MGGPKITRHLRTAILTVTVAACAPTAPPPKTAPVPLPPRASRASEWKTLQQPAPDDCAEERSDLRLAYELSGQRACSKVDDCVVAMSPETANAEDNRVVHAEDRADLVARAERLLARCGATAYYEPIEAYRVVEAACAAGRCAAKTTTFHIEDP